ncbi:MAG: SDR family oxidoreductase [Candidatus Organicella extenuata]|uniref:SDR family oxidoreductase n=1 Tax=Candidatus Organicella extenuata TaxID=2841811 RepID=A0AA51BK87_9BACT|nr:MAG: SDR family oxidoreductase [Candidatus Organicella extenuata]
MYYLYKKTVTITGVNTGIGFHIANFLIVRGFTLYGIGRKTNYLLDNSKSFNFIYADFLKTFSIKNLIIALKASVSINNAGFASLSYLYESTEASLYRQLNVMLTLTFSLASLSYRKLNNDYTSVFINSLASVYPIPFMGTYNICKSGLTGLYRSLDLENKKGGTSYFNFLLGDVKTRFNFKLKSYTPEASFFIKKNKRVCEALDYSIEKAPQPYEIALTIVKHLSTKFYGGEYTVSGFNQKTLTTLGTPLSWAFTKRFLVKYYGI